MTKLFRIMVEKIRAFNVTLNRALIGLFGFCVFLLYFYSVYGDTFREYPFQTQSLELNIHQIKKFINKRYWELRNPSLVPDTPDFDLNQILGISSSNNFKNPYSLWGSRSPLLGNASKGNTHEDDDRMLAQLLLLSENFSRSRMWNSEKKKILVSSRIYWWITEDSSPLQLFEGCPSFVNKCELIMNGTRESRGANISAAILPANLDVHKAYRPAAYSDNVMVFFYTLESYYGSRALLTKQNDILASYWTGSDIVAPYGKWVYYDPSIRRRPTGKNYAAGKDKLVAVFVSNCKPFNLRNQYIRLLQKHIQVDVYGNTECGGTLSCPRSATDVCFQKLKKEYKFYLAFENANCRDYITEKYWLNALSNDLIPIVMGAHPDDYRAASPQNSYIHVDDFKSTLELSDYLKYLDTHDDEYNKYFEWKGTGELIRGYFLCRLCAMLHYAQIVPPPNRTEVLDVSLTGLTSEQLCLPGNQTYWNSDLALE